MKTVWETYDEDMREAAASFAQEYRAFLDSTKTEREFVSAAVALAEQEGFTNIHDSVGELNPGDRLYAVNRDKNVCLFVIGEQPLTKGMKKASSATGQDFSCYATLARNVRLPRTA